MLFYIFSLALHCPLLSSLSAPLFFSSITWFLTLHPHPGQGCSMNLRGCPPCWPPVSQPTQIILWEHVWNYSFSRSQEGEKKVHQKVGKYGGPKLEGSDSNAKRKRYLLNTSANYLYLGEGFHFFIGKRRLFSSMEPLPKCYQMSERKALNSQPIKPSSQSPSHSSAPAGATEECPGALGSPGRNQETLVYLNL